MASFSPISKIIDAAINLDVANLNGELSNKEQVLKDNAILLGTMDYYRVFPLRSYMNVSYNTTGSNHNANSWMGAIEPKYEDGIMVLYFDDLFRQVTPRLSEDEIKEAYFLGVMRLERPAWNTYSNPGMWDKQLLGIQVNNTNFDLTKTIVSNTLDDLSTGQPKYTINRAKNRIEILSPWGFGLLALDMAWGFNSPEYVDMGRVDFLCKFISLRFIQAVIQAREGVQFEADFSISVDALKDRQKKLEEEVASIRNKSVLHIAQWS